MIYWWYCRLQAAFTPLCVEQCHIGQVGLPLSGLTMLSSWAMYFVIFYLHLIPVPGFLGSLNFSLVLFPGQVTIPMHYRNFRWYHFKISKNGIHSAFDLTNTSQ